MVVTGGGWRGRASVESCAGAVRLGSRTGAIEKNTTSTSSMATDDNNNHRVELVIDVAPPPTPPPSNKDIGRSNERTTPFLFREKTARDQKGNSSSAERNVLKKGATNGVKEREMNEKERERERERRAVTAAMQIGGVVQG